MILSVSKETLKEINFILSIDRNRREPEYPCLLADAAEVFAGERIFKALCDDNNIILPARMDFEVMIGEIKIIKSFKLHPDDMMTSDHNLIEIMERLLNDKLIN